MPLAVLAGEAMRKEGTAVAMGGRDEAEEEEREREEEMALRRFSAAPPAGGRAGIAATTRGAGHSWRRNSPGSPVGSAFLNSLAETLQAVTCGDRTPE